jgi:tetratricopeptide (TPR) repeat protein
LCLFAGAALSGCTTPTNGLQFPQFGQQAPTAGQKLAAALSPAAIGKAIAKPFKGNDDDNAVVTSEPVSEESSRGGTPSWWPFKKKAGPGADFYVSMAKVQEQMGDNEQAIEHYGRALEIDPDHAGALVGYAHLLDRLGQKVKATEYYVRAVKAHPKDAHIINDLGLCYARQGKFDKSLQCLEKAVSLQPDRDLYRNNIAAVLVEVGRVDEAVVQVAAVYGEPIAHYNVGVLLKEQGKRRAAANQFAKAMEMDPGLTQARDWLDRLTENQEPREQMASAEMTDSEANSVAAATAERAVAQPDEESQAAEEAKTAVASAPPRNRAVRVARREPVEAVNLPSTRMNASAASTTELLATDASAPGIPPSPDQAWRQATVDPDPATLPTPGASMRPLPALGSGYVPPSRY